jgi:hypothetical protein
MLRASGAKCQVQTELFNAVFMPGRVVAEFTFENRCNARKISKLGRENEGFQLSAIGCQL